MTSKFDTAAADAALALDPDLRAAGWAPIPEEDPFIGLIGPCWGRMQDGVLQYAFVAEKRHCNRSGIVHGGMVLAFIDQSVGTTAWELNGRAPQVTIDLNTHFIGAVRPGDFVEAQCRILNRTRSLLFVSATLTVAERIVASASGIYKVLGK